MSDRIPKPTKAEIEEAAHLARQLNRTIGGAAYGVAVTVAAEMGATLAAALLALAVETIAVTLTAGMTEMAAVTETAVATRIASALESASTAAFKAAGNAERFTAGGKHLAGAGGKWAKFAEGVNPNAVLREALESPGARFLPNDASSFKVITDLGRAVGTRGETGIRAIVDLDGHVVTWFPVRP